MYLGPRSHADSINLANFSPSPPFHCHLYKVDERKQKILAALVFFIVVRHVITVVAILQVISLHQHYVVMTMIFAKMVAQSSASRRTHNIWMYGRNTIL